jgi:hypothetical protein
VCKAANKQARTGFGSFRFEIVGADIEANIDHE